MYASLHQLHHLPWTQYGHYGEGTLFLQYHICYTDLAPVRLKHSKCNGWFISRFKGKTLSTQINYTYVYIYIYICIYINNIYIYIYIYYIYIYTHIYLLHIYVSFFFSNIWLPLNRYAFLSEFCTPFLLAQLRLCMRMQLKKTAPKYFIKVIHIILKFSTEMTYIAIYLAFC